MGISRWLCTHSTRNMLVKIVHPGGHVELHDRPVLAAEIMLRNPRCVVTYPHVFQQPWSVVPPDTMLMQGQKFYVVPISTIRKLQRHSQRQSSSSSSPLRDDPGASQSHHDEVDEGMICSCCLFTDQKTPNSSYTCLKQCDGDKPKCYSDSNCLMCLVTGAKIKAEAEDSKDDAGSTSTVGSPETREPKRKRSKDYRGKGIKVTPKRQSLSDNWQPNLDSICEE